MSTSTTPEQEWPRNNMLEAAWGIIANAGGGNWETQTPEWQKAAADWRDAYHRLLCCQSTERAGADSDDAEAQPVSEPEQGGDVLISESSSATAGRVGGREAPAPESVQPFDIEDTIGEVEKYRYRGKQSTLFLMALGKLRAAFAEQQHTIARLEHTIDMLTPLALEGMGLSDERVKASADDLVVAHKVVQVRSK